MRSFLICTLVVILTHSIHAQVVAKGRPGEYQYGSKLKGGYSLLYTTDDSMQYLYLQKGRKTIAELSSVSNGIQQKSLGYPGADFTSYFLLVHSYGSGNPHYIELIRKSNGNNIIEDGAAWIGADEKKEHLLYSKQDVPDEKDKMILLNIKTGKKQEFSFPADIFDGPGVLSRISIRQLTEKKLVINYDTQKLSKVKAYNR